MIEYVNENKRGFKVGIDLGRWKCCGKVGVRGRGVYKVGIRMIGEIKMIVVMRL